MSNLFKSSYTTEKSTRLIKAVVPVKEEAPQHIEGEQAQQRALSTEEVAQQVKAKLKEAEEQATQIIEKAERKAEDQRQQLESERQALQEEIQQARKKAEEQGYEEGFQNGQQQGYEALDNTIQTAQHVVEQANHDYKARLDDAEPEIVQLALEVAEKIIGSEIEHDEKWLSVVKGAIEQAKDYEEVRLYISIDHYDQTLYHKAEIESIISPMAKLLIYPARDLSAHSCLIETSRGTIDASIDSQLQEVKQKLMQFIKGQSS